MSSKIQQMHNTLSKIATAREEGKDTPEMQQWVDKVSGKDYGLVKILIDSFLKDYKNAPFSRKVLKILHYLAQFSPGIVEEQFIPNKDFPKVISIYIVETKLEDLTPQVFILLVRIFKHTSFKEVATDEFMKCLFNTLQFFQDQEYLTSVVFIIVCLCLEFPSNHKEEAAAEQQTKELADSNPVLKALKYHENARFFGETLVKLLNEGMLSQSEQCLECVQAIFATPSLQKDFFFKSDLPILQDIVLRQLSKVTDDDMRMKYLKVLLQMRKLFQLEEGADDARDLIESIKSPINDYPEKEVAIASEIEKYL